MLSYSKNDPNSQQHPRIGAHASAAFGSSLAREQKFDDERWRSRLFNPQARTFIAREEDDRRRVLSSITLTGPNPVPEELKSKFSLAGPALQWELSGVFTLPEARRQGIAAAVMEAAMEHVLKEGEPRGSDCLLAVVVYTANDGANSWYEEMGFRAYSSGEDQGRSTSELALLLPRSK